MCFILVIINVAINTPSIILFVCITQNSDKDKAAAWVGLSAEEISGKIHGINECKNNTTS